MRRCTVEDFASLYLVETGVFVLILGIAGRGDRWMEDRIPEFDGGRVRCMPWTRRGLSLALANGKYYTGSLYDVPLLGTVSWMAATALTRARVEVRGHAGSGGG